MALSSADSEGRAYRNASPGLRFFLTASLALALMFLDHRGSYLVQVRAYLGAAMYPLQVAINSPTAGMRWVRENLALSQRLLAENADLRRESYDGDRTCCSLIDRDIRTVPYGHVPYGTVCECRPASHHPRSERPTWAPQTGRVPLSTPSPKEALNR